MSSSLSQSPALQPPTNARGTPRRPPKLRSSCDACGAAKVRCDKTQPRCGRCVAGGLNCVYGLSRKFGKAPRKKPPVDINVSGETLPRPLAQNAHQQQQQQHQQQQQQQQQNSLSCCPDYRHLSGTTRPVKYEPQSAVSSNYGLEDSLMAMTSYASQDMFLRSPDAIDGFGDHFSFPDTAHNPTLGSDPRHHGTVDPLDLTFPSSDFQSFAEWIHPDDLMHTPESQTHDSADSASSLPSHHSSASISSLDSHSTHGLPDTSLLQTDSHNCHKLAYATLESLSFRQDTIAKGEHLTQTMDKVLNRNKQAVNSMHQLLQCPCSKSPHLAMLYASITSKILMWYQLAAGCTKPTTTWDYFSSLGSQPTPPLSASSSPSMAFVTPTSPMAAQNNFIVTPMQFSVGAFSVDDESAQEALRKQLLLSELKKAGNLIDLLSIQGRDELASGEVNDIYSALGTWLKCELNRTIASLKS
ncbi:hypothetical protein VSDG_07553 [Cytospora chrysosperma]|uniref:Zn(2)-C6 fungal-type domain-containing protein n=1 Tax=Cytospora chrysosperma TaxID=252740 RepID=A0A423VMA2_CYTCH|nr:hypothetical protein VSDG_07553 [Valsa sordida]